MSNPTQFPVAAPTPPWHLWGSSVQLTAAVTAGNAVGQASDQLAKVDYRRPETWSFWFGAKMINGNPILSTGVLVQVWIDVIVGVGRSQFDTRQPDAIGFGLFPGRSFCSFAWDIPLGPGTNILDQPAKYATSGGGVVLDDRDTTIVPRVEWIPAQSIQCNARLAITTVANPQEVTVEVSGYFAPRTHVRPDWFLETFGGQETGGT